MNKVAVCFFGQLRGDKETFDSILENIVKPNEADVYMHTWTYFDKLYLFENPNVDYSLDNKALINRQAFNISTLEAFKNTFNPKKILIEEQIVFDNTSYVANSPQKLRNDWPNKSDSMQCTAHGARLYQGMKSMALSKKISFGLIDDPGRYDVIILLRNDMLFNKHKDFKSEVINANDIFVYIINPEYVSDIIFAGSYESMSKLVAFHDTNEDFYINKNRGWTAEFNERHMKNYIDEVGLNIRNYNFIDSSMQSIIRYPPDMI